MGLLVSQITFKVCEVVVKFRSILKTAIMAIIAECRFHMFCGAKRKSKPL
jgi:hypothetical protein